MKLKGEECIAAVLIRLCFIQVPWLLVVIRSPLWYK